jgi:hypothetical protein
LERACGHPRPLEKYHHAGGQGGRPQGQDRQQRVFGASARLQQQGKYVPGHTFGMASSIVPTRVSHVRI